MRREKKKRKERCMNLSRLICINLQNTICVLVQNLSSL